MNYSLHTIEFVSPILAEMSTCQRPSTFVIEGIIGSGKSTILQLLSADVNLSADFAFKEEPFDSFTNYQGLDILQLFYRRHCDAFFFQSLVQKSQLVSQMAEQHRESLGRRLVYERSPHTTCAFVDWLEARGQLSTAQRKILVAESEAHLAISTLPPSQHVGLIYLEAPPTLALTRIAMRSRPGEETIELKELQLLNQQFHNLLYNDRSRWGAVHHIKITSERTSPAQVAHRVKQVLKEMSMQTYSVSEV